MAAFPETIHARATVLAAALAIAFVGLFAGKAFANPTGAEVVAGQASLVSPPNQLLITNSPGAIINWQSFSILPGELTQFIQQSSSSSVLNRITGQDPSKILGALQSNGKVFLINPNGIVFGVGARVDVNGLVASTLNLSNADFLSGNLKFSGANQSADVSNQGAITTPSGGQVYLIGSSVTNGGVITSPGGDVVLAAGQSVDLVDSNNPDVRIVISAPENQALNVGKVVADSGRVGIYGALINQMGLVSANSAVAGADGKIVFKSTGDTVLAENSVTTATGAGSGGTIEVTGNRVALTANAVVDVSGQTGGGTVLIGGGERGSDPMIQNAAVTYVAPTVQVKADALHNGDGGTVVVWSDQQTRMYGNISARGAGQDGEGGFVETSSKGFLDFHGVVDLRAPSGLAGTLALDPSDITIDASLSSSDISVSSSAPFDITAANATSTLSTTDLQNQLALGNVNVSTSSGAVAPSGGTITVASPLSWSNANTLRLEADQGIALNAPITAVAGTLSLTTANGDIEQSGGPITAAAVSAVALNGAVELTDSSNAVAVIAGSAGGALGFTLVNSGDFTVGVVPGSGVTSLSGITSLTALTGFGVVLQAPAAGNITIAAPINASAGVLVGAGGGGVVQGAEGLISADYLHVNAGSASGIGSSNAPLRTALGTLRSANSSGPVHISNDGDLQINFISAADAVNVSASGSVTTPTQLACDCTRSISGSSVVLAANGPMLLSGGAEITATDGVALYAGYDSASETYTSSRTLTVDSNVSGSTVGLFAGGAITTSGTLTGVVTESPSLYSGAPSLPSLAQCIATPVLPGCSSVLPSLSECTAAPSMPGCSAVLPTLAVCVASPATAGCSAVLPTVVACTADPAVAGCSAVLPTLAVCVASPATAGCSAVLPTVVACTADPAAAGCSAVLPTLAVCVASPTTAGCSAVLPTLAACTANPAAAGCSAVLPTVAACTANPAAAGCSAVLPTLAVCVSSPTTAGCSAVLPTLAACTASPAVAGCSAVLPSLAACVASPTTSGCSVVLPSLAQCSATPTLAGCSTVLPAVTQCLANPAAAGCAVVQPAKPVYQASNEVIRTINTVAGVSGDKQSSSLVPTSTTPGSTDAVDKKAEEKKSAADDKPEASKDIKAVKDEPIKKTYCN